MTCRTRRRTKSRSRSCAPTRASRRARWTSRRRHSECNRKRCIIERKALGLAIVGSGRIGTLRARLAAQHPAVHYLAVSDRDAAKANDLAQTVGAQFHSGNNREVIANPEVNAVIVSPSEGEHMDAVLQAVALGKPVLVEKPIALTLADADAMVAGI